MAQKCQRDCDVEEVYLSNEALEIFPDVSKFKNLKRLYLNKNKFFHIGQSLVQNCVLRELYLQENMLTEIKGAFKNLKCLKILFLHSNQLKDIANIVYEMRYMLELNILNLFLNPCAQEHNYRNYVIHSISSLEVFDRKAITNEEREKVFKIFNTDSQKIKDSIAFGHHITSKTDVKNQQEYHIASHSMNIDNRSCENTSLYNSDDDFQHFKDQNISDKERYETAIKVCATKRTANVYKTFSWVDIVENQSSEKETDQQPVIFTAKFK